jgi:hypothetical protein
LSCSVLLFVNLPTSSRICPLICLLFPFTSSLLMVYWIHFGVNKARAICLHFQDREWSSGLRSGYIGFDAGLVA